MTETFNINSHYSNEPKAKLPDKPIVKGPDTVPEVHLYNDAIAKERFRKLDNDIFVMRKKEEKKPVKSFLKILTGTVLTITGFFLLKKFFKKS